MLLVSDAFLAVVALVLVVSVARFAAAFVVLVARGARRHIKLQRSRGARP